MLPDGSIESMRMLIAGANPLLIERTALVVGDQRLSLGRG
jgi:hypothetical protein